MGKDSRYCFTFTRIANVVSLTTFDPFYLTTAFPRGVFKPPSTAPRSSDAPASAEPVGTAPGTLQDALFGVAPSHPHFLDRPPGRWLPSGRRTPPGCEHSTPWPFGSFYLPPPVSPPDGFREVRASSQSRWAARSPAMNSSQRGPSPRPGENRHLGRPALWGRMHQPHPLAWEVNSPPPTPRGRDPCVEVRLGVGEVRSAAKQV